MQIFLVEIKVIKEVCIYTYIYEERLGRRNNKNQKKEKKNVSNTALSPRLLMEF
jgi:hypothetical protein